MDNITPQPLNTDSTQLSLAFNLTDPLLAPIPPNTQSGASVPQPLTPPALSSLRLTNVNPTIQLPVIEIGKHFAPASSSVTAPTSLIIIAPPENINITILPNFAIKSEGRININGSSDFDGDPLNYTDDALIHAAKGFTINGNTELSIQRDASGNPLKDANNKLRLVNNTVTVATGALTSTANGSANRYGNLLPPQIIPQQAVQIPVYTEVKERELARRIPTGTATVTFNPQTSPINTVADWNSKFPTAGTTTMPKVVRIASGGLNIPNGVVLNNYVLIVEQGDINFNGTSQQLNNVMLIANNGNVNLANIQSDRLSVFASGSINTNGAARFGGNTLLVSASTSCNISFNGATKNTSPTENLTVIAQGNITFNGATTTRGTFLSGKDFTFNGSSALYGSIGAKGNITFNGNSTVVGAFADLNAPVINTTLVQDTAPKGTTNSDLITFDPRVTGSVTDASLVMSFVARIDGGIPSNLIPSLNASGNFTFTRTQLEQIAGKALLDGVHTLQLQASDLYGNLSAATSLTFTLDTTEAAPTQLQLNPGNDSGNSNSDRITKVTQPIITGKATPGGNIELYRGTQLVGTGITAANGSWQITTSSLPTGVQNLIAIATDIAGNISPSSSPLSVTIDPIAPLLNLTQRPDSTPLWQGAKLKGTIDGTGSSVVSLVYQWDTRTAIPLAVNSTGSFEQVLDYTGIINGAHQLTLISTDVAGNISSSVFNVLVQLDVAAPVINAGLVVDSGSSNSDRITNDGWMRGTITDASQIVEFKAGFDDQSLANYLDALPYLQNGSFSFNQSQLEQIYGRTIPDKIHTLNLIASDIHGNRSSIYPFTFTLDTTILVPTLNLTASSDTGIIGDYQTKSTSITITGQTEANARVFLSGYPTLVTADSLGNYSFANVALTAGYNLLTVTATDIAGNQQTYTRSIYRTSPPTGVSLATPQVLENSTDNTIVGGLITVDPDGIDNYVYTLVDNAGGRFKLVGNKIQVANGSLLDFEVNTQHQIQVLTTDSEGDSYLQSIAISVLNLNEAPTQLVLDTTSIAENSPIGTLVGKLTSTDPDLGDSHTYSLVTGNGSGDNAKFSIVSNELRLNISPDFETQSVYHLRVQTADAGGLTWVQELTVNILDLPENILVEGTSFNKHLDIPITIPATGGKLSFKLNPLQFDGADLNGINDALEVALVDAQGKSVVIPFQTGRDAFFNWTEGEPVATGKGASYDPATGIITLDLTGVKPGAANLVFRLINNDTDTTTRVTVTDITLAPITPIPALANSNTPTLPSTPKPVAITFFNSATDVSASIGADYHRTSFNAGTKELDVNVALKNQGSYGLNGTLVVVVNHISDPSVQVKNADGFTPEGLAYYTFTASNGKLDPTQVTDEQTLVFKNPNGVQFSYDLTVLAEINAAPVIKSSPELEVIGGKNYQYQIQAEDLNGDSLSYKLLSAPSGMSIDPSTGLVSWNTSVGAVGNYQLSVEVSDGRGGIAEQNYNLAVITPPPNRPPVFTSTPVVDTAIGSVYSYQGIAKDPDGDSLIYSLTTAPSGMTVDANTGILTWIPTGSQLGTFDVSLGVADNRGGVAQQQFKIRTGATVGNHAPIITSNAELKSYVGNPYSYQVQALDADLDVLNYSLVSAPSGIIIDANTGKISWANPQGTNTTQNITVKVSDSRGGIDTQTFGLLINANGTLGTIRGTIWEDGDGAGIKDPSERGLSGIKVYLDSNQNGKLDANELTMITNERGEYSFSNLVAGNYLVREVLPEGFEYTAPQPSPVLSSINLIKNGSFESGPAISGLFNTLPTGYTGIANWVVTGHSVDYTPSSYWQASDGTKSIDLSGLGNGGMTQTINTTPGQNYLITFDLAANRDLIAGFKTPMRLRTSSGQESIFIGVASGSRTDMKYKTYSWQFTATNTSTKIEFISESAVVARGAVLDKVFAQEILSTNDFKQVVNLTAGSIATNINFGNRQINQLMPNQAPTITSNNPAKTAIVGDLWRYEAMAIDPDQDPLTYELVVKPEGMVIDPKTGVLVWKPTSDQITGKQFAQTYGFEGSKSGIYDVILAVKDDQGEIDIQSFQVQVVAPNTAPIFTNVPLNPLSATVNSPVEYQFRAIDADNDPVSYRIVNPANAVGAMINVQTGVFAWTTASQSLGSYSFTVGATDGKGVETLQNFMVDLQNLPNLAPVIASTPRSQTSIGQTYFYQIAATDPNSDSLTYNLINPPAGMSVNNQGLLSWTPNSTQLGQSAIQIQVSDGRGGITTQQFGLDVVNFGNLVNHSPEITSIPTFTTNLDKTYSYQLTGKDSDNDTLIWSLDNAPKGMVIDAQTGILKWNPTSTQRGTHTVAVRLTDAYGLYVGQEYTLKVNGINTPPQIQSSPNTIGGLNSPYKYQIEAIDLDGDALKYTLGRRPNGMIVNSNTGLITWTPNSTQLGTQIIDVLVTDAQGAVTTQTYNLVVGTTPINQAPTITSTPKFTADINTKYQYQIVATDPENQQLTYALTTAPAGMVIDTTTGLITWDNPTLGTTNILLTATDTSGAVAAQGYTLTGKQNQAPVINSTPKTQVTIGNTYRYDVIAKDPDNDALAYSLDTAATTAGVSIDKLGRITWKPTTPNIGIQPVTITVTDASGAAVTQTYNLEVLADNLAPTINLVRSTNIANIGETISFQVQATDNVGIKSTQLLIDNQAVTLDSNGVGTYKVTTAGLVTATAIVTDINGNTSTATTTTNIIDPSDIEAPNIKLDLSSITNGIITGRTDIKGTVTDTNLDYYTLEVARFGTNNWQEVFRGTTSVTNGSLGKFDPSLLSNDTYRVRLTAYDTGGRGSQIEDEIEVTGDLKLGNFRLSFTDLTIPVTGIPISLTRTYDSLTSGTTDDFGYGWRMEFRDTDLRTSLKADSYYEQLDYRTVGFNFGTRIYITLPGGRREGFTFQPKQVQGALGGLTGGRLYYPNFVSDKGVTSTLTVPGAEIKANTNVYSANVGTSSGNPNGVLLYKEGKLFNLAGRPYVPQDDGFGNRYILTTKDGTKYEINATTGDLESVTDTNGNTLTYSDTEIKSSTGVKVTFERDNQGRITSVTDPLGQKVKYGYDVKGDLVSVTDRDGNTTGFQYNATRSHYLDKIVDPLGREAVKTEYDEAGRLKKTANSSGNGVEFVYNPLNSLETVKDALGNPTTYEYDTRGNVVTEVDAVGKITKSTYDDDNNMLSETVISDRSGAAGFTTTYTYDNQRNKLSETDALGNTTYYTYGDKGRLLITTDALGRTTTNAFDGNGNLVSTKDAIGNITTFTYDGKRQVTQTIDAQGNITRFEYDNNGNFTKIVDVLGYSTNSTYNSRGNKLSETKLVTTATGLLPSTTIWTYDNDGHMLTMTDALGRTTTYEYNKLGQQAALTDALGRVTRMVYDNDGRLIETIEPDATPDDLTDNPRTKTQYDAIGREVATIDEAGRITRTVYDAVGRVIETILPDFTPNDNSDNPRTKTEYYSDGTIKARIDERGNRTEYRYDAAGRQTDVIYADSTPLDLTDNPKTHYQYNQAGQQISVTDALNHTTRYQYDNLGRAVKIIYADDTFTATTYDSLGRRLTASDKNGIITEYRYDAVGKFTGVKNALGDWTNYAYTQEGSLLSITDTNNHSTSYEYDLLGRRAATILPLNQRSTTSYNAVGNVSTMTDFNGKTTTYKYDAQNRLVEQDFTNDPTVTMTYTVDGQIATITDGRGVTSFSYDVQNRLISKTDVDGSKISYTYDLAGNRTSVTTQVLAGNYNTTYYTFDERNRLDKVLSGGVVLTDYDYDGMSNLIKTTLSNGVIETRQYDKLNHLLNLQTNKGNNILTNFVYTLDKIGNRQQVIETVGSNTRTVGYIYDDLYRLTKEQVTDGVNGNRTTEFVYDKVGNRQQQQVTANNVVTATTYQYDANDRLLKEQVNGNDKVIYTYDNNGNTLTKTEESKTTKSIWNDQNRLVGVKVKDNAGVVTQQVGYEYDASGIRVSQNVDGEITKYLIDANLPYAQAVVEYRPSGLAVVSYTHGNDLISQTRDGVSSFYHVDGLGSTRGLSDAGGSLIDTYSYQAFGELLNSSGGSENKYLYAGEQFDPVLGDYYNRARYYDPDTGNFISRDTFEGSQDYPFSLHKYQYADRNPIVNLDPTGNWTLSELTTIGSIIGTLSGASVGGYIGYVKNDNKIGWPVFAYAAAGALTGLVLGAQVGSLIGAFSGMSSGLAHGGALGTISKMTPKLVEQIQRIITTRSLIYGADGALKSRTAIAFTSGVISGGITGTFTPDQYQETVSVTALSTYSGGNGLIIGYRWVQQNLLTVRPSVPGGIEVASMYVAGFNLGYFAALGIRQQIER